MLRSLSAHHVGRHCLAEGFGWLRRNRVALTARLVAVAALAVPVQLSGQGFTPQIRQLTDTTPGGPITITQPAGISRDGSTVVFSTGGGLNSLNDSL